MPQAMACQIVNQVKDRRVERGWSQEQLSALAGVSRQSINSIERNRYVPSLELALRLAQIFDSTVEAIFQLEELP
uniref:Putative HTH-type transcriptional regulator n=1 Tax=mine drainage metagenome TaxID=410659 RepID=E6QKT4_9ZZZZ